MISTLQKIIPSIAGDGVSTTLRRGLLKVGKAGGLLPSDTEFFATEIPETAARVVRDDLQIMKLLALHAKEFKAMRYFSWIDPAVVLADANRQILVAVSDGQIVGYVVLHWGKQHEIHKLGSWLLRKNEAWIGPTYVVPESRKRGVHSALLKEATIRLSEAGVKKTFTCVNLANRDSRRSFVNNGFEAIGVLRVRRTLSKIRSAKIIVDVGGVIHARLSMAGKS